MLENNPIPFIAPSTGRAFAFQRPTRGKIAYFFQYLAMRGVRDVREIEEPLKLPPVVVSALNTLPQEERDVLAGRLAESGISFMEQTDGRGILMEALVQAWVVEAPPDWHDTVAEAMFAKQGSPRPAFSTNNVDDQEFIEVGEELLRLDEPFRSARSAYRVVPRIQPG
jgi:hypothetical protein